LLTEHAVKPVTSASEVTNISCFIN